MCLISNRNEIDNLDNLFEEQYFFLMLSCWVINVAASPNVPG